MIICIIHIFLTVCSILLNILYYEFILVHVLLFREVIRKKTKFLPAGKAIAIAEITFYCLVKLPLSNNSTASCRRCNQFIRLNVTIINEKIGIGFEGSVDPAGAVEWAERELVKRKKKWEGKWTVRKSDRSTNFTPLNVIYRTFISHPFQCLHPIKRFWNIIGSFFLWFVVIFHRTAGKRTLVGHFLNDIFLLSAKYIQYLLVRFYSFLVKSALIIRKYYKINSMLDTVWNDQWWFKFTSHV